MPKLINPPIQLYPTSNSQFQTCQQLAAGWKFQDLGVLKFRSGYGLNLCETVRPNQTEIYVPNLVEVRMWSPSQYSTLTLRATPPSSRPICTISVWDLWRPSPYLHSYSTGTHQPLPNASTSLTLSHGDLSLITEMEELVSKKEMEEEIAQQGKGPPTHKGAFHRNKT